MQIKWDGIGAFSCGGNMQRVSFLCKTGYGCILGLGSVLTQVPPHGLSWGWAGDSRNGEMSLSEDRG